MKVARVLSLRARHCLTLRRKRVDLTTLAPFKLRSGTRPLLVSMPHVGTHIPLTLQERMTPEALTVPDTDWHLEPLYEFAQVLGASVIAATHSRYVVDVNRPPDNENLYPGQNTTGLCPTDAFDETPLYLEGQAPEQSEVLERREAYWRPYHHALQAELLRLRERHGAVALWDAHSIRSVVPRFFEGRLPDLNLGTVNGTSCASVFAEAVYAVAQRASGFSAVLNGRFKGGYITRQYGRPTEQIHAIQLEIALRAYMEEVPPFRYDANRAAILQPALRAMLEVVLEHVEGLCL